MNKRNKIVTGVQDYLPLEFSHKQKLESGMMELFKQKEYQQIETPTIEYMDVFCIDNGGFDQESMFKLSDDKGNLLVMRPDITMPIARMAATCLADNEILRLCYCSDVFSFNGDEHEGYKQLTQIGMEFLGECSAKADAEVLILAIEALRKAGLKNFQIDVGQASFFEGLMNEAGLSKTDSDNMRYYVEEKDMLEIELLLQKCNIKGSVKNDIMTLPTLYGGVEILDIAEKYNNNPICKKAIDNLKEVMMIIDDKGLSDYISIDLSIVQSVHYYTGIVFKGISSCVGYPLLTGGRYDDLVKYYGKDMPAIGFAMTSKHMLIALEREGAFL